MLLLFGCVRWRKIPERKRKLKTTKKGCEAKEDSLSKQTNGSARPTTSLTEDRIIKNTINKISHYYYTTMD